MTRMNSILSRTLTLAIVLGGSLVWAQSAEDLRMTAGKSIVIDYPSDIRQISTSDPAIIDASPITTREILLHGKGLGNATMVVWSKAGERTFYNINVEMNVEPLRRILKETFPKEAIDIQNSRDSLTLNGKVSTKEVSDRSMALAANYAKTVVNNLQVSDPGADKQILLRVRFAELDRNRSEQFGINWFAAPGGNPISATTGQFGSTSVGNTAQFGQGTSNGSTGTMSVSQALNAFAFSPNLNIGAFLKALQTEAVLQILAEPNLVTTNGKEAYFLVGGEVPIASLQGGSNSGAVTIQFKEFGIRLRFTPVITEHNTIKLHLTQEVSTIEKANGITLSGFFIPGFATRRADTDVELAESQSFVVAGLLDNRETESFSKLPMLSSLPVLGSLFKSKDVSRSRTDLIMIVTPEITQPLNPGDPRPEIYFPKDFLVRMGKDDVQGSAKTGTKN
jgi:pilus assembly protein CpaC